MSRQLLIELVGDAGKAVKALQDTGTASNSFGDKISNAGTKMTAFVSVPILGFLASATKAAAEDEAGQASLAKTLELTTGNSKALVTQVEAYITKAQKASTFTDDELRPAFETLVRTTHNADEANQLLTLSTDLATAKNIDLATASMVVAKAHEGNFAAVNKLVPGLIDMTDKTLTVDGAMGQLSNTVGGSAAAATETAAGKAKMMTRDLGELQEKIGGELLPVVSKLTGFFVDSLIPTLDKLSGDNGALILLGVAAIGPLTKLVTALNSELAITALRLAPLLAIPIGIGQIKEDSKKGLAHAILGNSPISDWLDGHDNGGIVAGMPGTSQMIMAHAGEKVLPYRGGQNIGDNGSAGGPVTISLNVDGQTLAQIVATNMQALQRRGGTLGFTG